MMVALEHVYHIQPRRKIARLRLGCLYEQAGETGAAGRAFDEVIEALAMERIPLSAGLTRMLLQSAQIGPDPTASSDRLHILSEVAHRFTNTQPLEARILGTCIQLALENRDRFLTASRQLEQVDDPRPDERVAQLKDLATRWASPTFPDRGTAKIFVIGLSRTGTTSTHHALARLGFQSLHWTNDLTGALPRRLDFDLFDAASDTPVAATFEELHAVYPSARFIWTRRDRESWVKSVAEHFAFGLGISQPAEFSNPAVEQLYGGGFGPIHQSLYGSFESWEAALTAHDERVVRHFDGAPEGTLLEFRVTGGDGWHKLCRFIDRPVPDEPFPHQNHGNRAAR